MPEILPLPTGKGTWTEAGRKLADSTKTEILPLPTGKGTWTVIDAPARRGTRNLGMSRGSRSIG